MADVIGKHMMSRIVDLLSPPECDKFHRKLILPEMDIFKHLEQLSEENNNLKKRQRREIKSTEECRSTLLKLLKTEGNTLYWDRISRAFRQIGRPDLASELGKNLNQDKNLELIKNVEGYHASLKKLQSSFLVQDEEKYEGSLRKQRDLQDINWDELELIIERETLPPYSRKISDGLKPLLYGILLGFLGSTVAGSIIVYFTIWITEKDFGEIMQRTCVIKGRRRKRQKQIRTEKCSSDDEMANLIKPGEKFQHYFPPFNLRKHSTLQDLKNKPLQN
ncbi:transmembrane and death domain protein 1-like isoform X1 [Latimeria chalumnae]|nr:PREDICTED: uncharacterized protein LOC102358817 isoform X2 [Latimeria chalumnae]|eukprot:XP_005987725.1 PREDICTED: uncharacterized protein LOC102358817 isoform X2 [Latimeria chalumnae]